MKLKHWVKQTQSIPLREAPKDMEPSVSDISVQRLIDKCLVALDREVRNLLTLSAAGKLDPNDARDLRDHLKLLFELKKREDESLLGLGDEKLEAMAKESMNDSKQDSAIRGDDSPEEAS